MQSWMEIIPQEILMDILIRLPAKFVGCCRCVSKQWRHLLTKPRFIRDHLERTKQSSDNDLLLLESSDSNTLYSAKIDRSMFDKITLLAMDLTNVLEEDFWNEGMPSCDGLIILKVVKDAKDKIWLVNPTMKESRELPHPTCVHGNSSRYTVFGLGYDHVADDYKVLAICHYCSFNKLGIDWGVMYAHVYSLRNGIWKQVEVSPYKFAIKKFTSGVFVGGSIHWIMENRTSYRSNCIIGFDLTEEEFWEVPTPSSIYEEYSKCFRLMVLGGCLCVVNEWWVTKINIWMMKEYGVEKSWTRFSVFYDGVSALRPCIGGPGQREVVFSKNSSTGHLKFVLYNLDSGEFKDITVEGVNDDGWLDIDGRGSFYETLVSPYHNSDARRLTMNNAVHDNTL